ncbi:MAG TPA: YdcF family protein [Candidatus Pacearchaeota archaeon]|nr:YdcF family protein [Candidatus Pacearchaeota archaeon]HOL90306.1 YdcF family protein [Candidatus Pacearchaeota archaeon]HPO68520.1 YdcF family protein [Candidatus Pacearchaeota archaeon]
MIFFKILQEFLLPSVFILFLLLIGLVFSFRKKKRKIGKLFLFLGILLYYLFSITPISNLIISPLENKYLQIKNEELNKANKIVLLLGGKESDVLRLSEVLRIYFLKNKNAQIIVSGRDPLLYKREEGEEIKNYLIERGVNKKDIILENESKNTKESALNVKKIVQDESFFLITSSYHMPRSAIIFKKQGLNFLPAPTDFKIEKDYSIIDYFPDAKNLRNCDLAFHEYFGIIYFRLLIK